MWGEVSRDVGESREGELSSKFFKPVIDRGAKMFRHLNTAPSAQNIVRMVMKNPPVTLQIQRELVDQRIGIIETMAGKTVNQELSDQFRRYQAELWDVRAEIKQALRRKDDETMRELEEVVKTLQKQMEEADKDSKGMSTNYAAEKQRMKVRIKGMEEEAKKRGRGEAGVSVTDRARPKQQTRRSQDLVGIPGTIPPDDPVHHDTSPTRTKVAEWTDQHQRQLSPTSPHSSPQIPSPMTSYVQAFFRSVVTHRY